MTLKVQISIGDNTSVEEPVPSPTGQHYVYVHKREDGHVFYVGKGVGTRAHSTDRLDLWHRYIETRCNGKYEIVIVARFDTDEEALAYECQMISELGSQLVNWINPGRQFDCKALEQFHSLRDKNRTYIASLKDLEATNPDAAIESYRIALARMDEYSSIVHERGLIPELMREIGFPGYYVDLQPLDRLSLLLLRLGRFEDLISDVDMFVTKYPRAMAGVLGQCILKRRAKSATRLQSVLS